MRRRGVPACGACAAAAAATAALVLLLAAALPAGTADAARSRAEASDGHILRRCGGGATKAGPKYEQVQAAASKQKG